MKELENVIEYGLNYIIDIVGEATEEKAKEIEENISLYINDIVENYIEVNQIEITEDQKENLKNEIEKKYKSL